MIRAGLSVWGDSIAKGIIYDETRGRYSICRDSCLMRLSREIKIPVQNHSVMGQTTENGLARMQADALKAGEIAVIEYGGNDCDLDWKAVSEHPEREQFGKVPVEKFRENLAEMVRRVREAGMLPVLVTPPPLIASRYFDWVSRGLNRENILGYLGNVERIFHWQANYAEQVRALAGELNVFLVDIRSCMLAENLADLMCVDGIHPNARGHAVIYNAVAPLLA